ncbi:MAG TPA: ArgE/DapE family deacylase [Actinomycetota bacterium]|nr:ArgE/DapE family deacylase [Actinomycetota bacterium]
MQELPAEPLEVPEDGLIAEAIAAETEWMQEILARLVEKPTVLGNEEPGQAVMREALREVGLEPVDVPMDAEVLREHPLASPFDWDVSGSRNVVARWDPEGRDGGSSLILNGHIDVVSPEPVSRWARDPFVAHVEDEWLSGRGSADMKCGLAAILGAVKGLRRAGLRPHAPVTIQSVVEEECTGNGTLQTLLAGYTADAAVIAEPYGSAITTSQVGVLWFQVVIEGIAGHAGDEKHGINAIEQSLRVIPALRELEAELNADPPPPYDAYAHPIGLNVGTIAGGDWPSTVPGECVTGYRIALFPGMDVAALQARIEAVVAGVAAEDPASFPLPPRVRFVGFRAEGYEVDPEHPLVRTVAGAHARVFGTEPARISTTSTTDARVFGQVAGIPAVCFGPYAEGAHGSEERVYLPSVVQTAQVLGLTIRDWSGLS